MKKTLIVGPAKMDLCALVDKLPQSDEEIHPQRTFTRVGGCGWCNANVFQLLNLPYSLLSPIGTGIYADSIRVTAEELEIPLGPNVDAINGCTYTMIDPQGNRGVMAIHGAELQVQRQDFRNDSFDSCEVLLLSGEILQEGSEEWIPELSKWNSIYYQPGMSGIQLSETLQDAIYALHPTLLLSEEELAVLKQANEEADLLELVNQLTKKTQAPAVVLMRDGTSLYAEGRNCVSVSSAFEDVKDASGVMESFAAAFVCARNSGCDPRKACSFATTYANAVAKLEEEILPKTDAAEMRTYLIQAILENPER